MKKDKFFSTLSQIAVEVGDSMRPMCREYLREYAQNVISFALAANVVAHNKTTRDSDRYVVVPRSDKTRGDGSCVYFESEHVAHKRRRMHAPNAPEALPVLDLRIQETDKSVDVVSLNYFDGGIIESDRLASLSCDTGPFAFDEFDLTVISQVMKCSLTCTDCADNASHRRAVRRQTLHNRRFDKGTAVGIASHPEGP